jgi:hypothetical protein
MANLWHTSSYSMACAIREAYAATLTVVILVENQRYDGDG